MSEKRYFMRVYDETFERRIEEYYKKSKKQFVTKNDFFVTCFDYGLTMLENSSKLQLEEFLKSKDFVLDQKVNQLILDNIYGLLEYFAVILKADRDILNLFKSSSLSSWVLELKEKLKNKGGN